MLKRLVITLMAIGAIFVGIFGWKARMDKKAEAMMKAPRPAVAVTATSAKEETWRPVLDAVGSLRAVAGVHVTSELAGKVVGIHFESGQAVKKGDLLVQLNDAPERALREQYRAAMSLAELELARAERLVVSRAISVQDRDRSKSARDQARAQMTAQEAVIAQKAIRAPFSGILGIRLVDLGQYVNPGSEVVTLQALDPIYADYALPQQELPHVHVGQAVSVRVDAYPGKSFPGKITAINPEVNPATRNFSLRATLDNPNLLLRPGMFAHASTALEEREKVITLPQAAVTFSPYGSTIFVLEEKETPEGKKAMVAGMRFVIPGEARGDQVEIKKGVKPGEMVVTSGQMKLRQGTVVTINNEVAPSDSPNPQVPEG